MFGINPSRPIMFIVDCLMSSISLHHPHRSTLHRRVGIAHFVLSPLARHKIYSRIKGPAEMVHSVKLENTPDLNWAW